ncbi:hypothetical protein PHYC_01907 [Phycisphaerales bacterium]|nr:hypothetical protein PHYC_01907 [Phycisphaerales bacterium]
MLKTRLVLPLLALLALCVSAPRSAAQSMAISVYSPRVAFAPEFSKGDITIVARVLTLSDSEREALIALHEGYVQALRSRGEAIGEDMEERIERAQALSSPELAQAKPEEINAWDAEAKKHKEAFLDDLKSLLTREQADRWPLAERELRRFKSIGSGRLRGESVDLVRLIEEGLPKAWTNPQVAEVLVRYAEAMDSALRAREDYITGERQNEFQSKASSDRDAAAKIWEEALAKRVAVRDLNLRFAEQVAALLPEDLGERLRRAVFEKSFPSLVKPTRSESVIRAAAALTSLSSSQQETIRGMVADYDARRMAILREMSSVLKERDLIKRPASLDPDGSDMTVATTSTGESISFYSSANLKSDPNDPMTPLQQRRFDLDRTTRRKVEAVLTPEQKDAVKQPTQDMILIDFDEPWGL